MVGGAAHGHGGGVGDVGLGDLDGERLGAQALAAAVVAGGLAEELAQVVAGGLGVGLAVAPHEVGDDALVAHAPGAVGGAALAAPLDGDALAGVGAVEDEAALLLGELGPGDVEVDLAGLGEALDDAEGPALAALHGGGPGGDGAVADREAGVGDDEVLGGLHAGAEAVAGRAHAERAVEGEALRVELREGLAAAGAGLAEEAAEFRGLAAFSLGCFGADLPVALAQGELDGLGDPALVAGAGDDAVDDDGDVVLELLVELRGGLERVDLAVDLDADEAAAAQLLEEVLVFALAVGDDGGEQDQAGVFGLVEQLLDDLLRRGGADRLAALGAVLDADAGVEDAQVVVDLGDGADGGARVVRGALLLDGDGGREAAQVLDLGALELAEELAGVGGEALDVAALALGVEGVEGEAGLAGAADPGEDDELALGDLQLVDAEVVLVGAADLDEVGLAHGCACRRGDDGAGVRRGEGVHARELLLARDLAPAPRAPSRVADSLRTCSDVQACGVTGICAVFATENVRA